MLHLMDVEMPVRTRPRRAAVRRGEAPSDRRSRSQLGSAGYLTDPGQEE